MKYYSNIMSADKTTIDKDNLEEIKEEELSENDDDNGAIEIGTKSIEDPEIDLKDDKMIDVAQDPSAEEEASSSDTKKKRCKVVPVDAPWKERMWESTYRINLFSVTTTRLMSCFSRKCRICSTRTFLEQYRYRRKCVI